MSDARTDNTVAGALASLADTIAGSCFRDSPVAVIGVRSRGDVLAKRLDKLLSDRGLRVDCHGVLDITLYRDDLDHVGGHARVRSTEIAFDVTGCTIILVDDVIFTGRTARAALDALMDLGRPRAVRLAVLVDRGGRELPIQPDFVGLAVRDQEPAHVQVKLEEVDGVDEIVFKASD